MRGVPGLSLLSVSFLLRKSNGSVPTYRWCRCVWQCFPGICFILLIHPTKTNSCFIRNNWNFQHGYKIGIGIWSEGCKAHGIGIRKRVRGASAQVIQRQRRPSCWFSFWRLKAFTVDFDFISCDEMLRRMTFISVLHSCNETIECWRNLDTVFHL